MPTARSIAIALLSTALGMAVLFIVRVPKPITAPDPYLTIET
jgi:hypothetical protein